MVIWLESSPYIAKSIGKCNILLKLFFLSLCNKLKRFKDVKTYKSILYIKRIHFVNQNECNKTQISLYLILYLISEEYYSNLVTKKLKIK